MIYKKEIGGHIEMRDAFLIRWRAATNSKLETTLSASPTEAETLLKGILVFILLKFGRRS